MRPGYHTCSSRYVPTMFVCLLGRPAKKFGSTCPQKIRDSCGARACNSREGVLTFEVHTDLSWEKVPPGRNNTSWYPTTWQMLAIKEMQRDHFVVQLAPEDRRGPLRNIRWGSFFVTFSSMSTKLKARCARQINISLSNGSKWSFFIITAKNLW